MVTKLTARDVGVIPVKQMYFLSVKSLHSCNSTGTERHTDLGKSSYMFSSETLRVLLERFPGSKLYCKKTVVKLKKRLRACVDLCMLSSRGSGVFRIGI